MSRYDWSKFSQRVAVNASVRKVYDAWTKRGHLEKWFLRKAEFTRPDGVLRKREESVQKGDRYEWMWFGYNDEVFERGQVLKANGKDLFQFVFGRAGLVMVKLRRVVGKTLVELAQEKIPLDETSKVNFHLGCSTGWTFYLANLKSILEGGLDLRNKNVKLERVINS